MENLSKNIIEEKLVLLPDKPGVYIMKNTDGDILYVGKAIVLKNRVRSYFRSSGQANTKTKLLVSQIADFEYIVTDNEVEALILECNLIKKHKPKYNILLKDDKSYPYLKLTLNEEYPRLLATRRLLKDGGEYFGPYTSSTMMHETVGILRKIFPLRTCKTMNAKRPCLEYHIKRCLAPCTGKVDKVFYDEMVKGIKLFLNGRSELLIKKLKKDMVDLAQVMQYEKAAKVRDQINALENVSKQQIITALDGDFDIIGMAIDKRGVCAQVFFVRSGKVVGREHFLLTGSTEDEKEEILSSFIKQYYSVAAFVPKDIIVPYELSEVETDLLIINGQEAFRSK